MTLSIHNHVELLASQGALHGWMGDALALARQAGEQNEVPVGALVADLDTGTVLGTGFDRRVALCDPSAHAEVLALRAAATARGDWRLERTVLVVTLEPCLMCAGAALLARVPAIVYGASNPKFGAIEAPRTALDPAAPYNHQVHTYSGIRAEECAAVLRDWFTQHRRR